MTSSPSILPDNKFFSYSDFISGWAAGIVSTCVGHPMETIRVIQQVANTSAIKATRDIYSQDKFAGYYRGMMFPILSTGVISSAFFGINGTAMRLIQIHRGDGTRHDIGARFCCETEQLDRYWHLDVFVSGCIGGFFCTVINTPNEVIKTMLQASNISTSKTAFSRNTNNDIRRQKITKPIKLIVELYKTNGIRSLYRGGTPLMIRDVFSSGIYMLSYEHVCCMLMRMRLLNSKSQPTAIKNELMPKYIYIISGGLAGVLSWISVLPFDVIKSKIIADSVMQPLYKGAWDCAKKTYAEGGANRFFQGFWLLCLRAFPVNGISLLVYEMALTTCSNNGIK